MLSSNGPSSVHPKIQIESKEDILFLKKELESAGRMALADTLASSGLTGQDALELTLQKRVHQWVEDLFELGSDNIQINGLDYKKAFQQKQEFEPFNEQLRQQVQEAQDAVNALTVKVTDLRKTVPSQLGALQKEESELFMKKLETVEFDSLSSETDLHREAQMAQGTVFVCLIQKEKMKQMDFGELQSECKSSIEKLNAAEKSLPQMLMKMERASQVMDTLQVPDLSQENNLPQTPLKPLIQEPKTPFDRTTPHRAIKGLLSQFE